MQTLKHGLSALIKRIAFWIPSTCEARKAGFKQSKKVKPNRRKSTKICRIDKKGIANVKRWMQCRANRGLITTHKDDFEHICKLNGLNPENVRVKLACSRIIIRSSKNKFYPFTCLLAKTPKKQRNHV